MAVPEGCRVRAYRAGTVHDSAWRQSERRLMLPVRWPEAVPNTRSLRL